MIISWLFSTLAMFGVSYVWHGVFLNDLKFIEYPLSMFLSLAAIVYLGIGGVISLGYFFLLNNKSNMILKGLAFGAVSGFFVYLVAFVLGISFATHSMDHVLVDFIWQMLEQGLGGAAVGLIFDFFKYSEKEMEEKEQLNKAEM